MQSPSDLPSRLRKGSRDAFKLKKERADSEEQPVDSSQRGSAHSPDCFFQAASAKVATLDGTFPQRKPVRENQSSQTGAGARVCLDLAADPGSEAAWIEARPDPLTDLGRYSSMADHPGQPRWFSLHGCWAGSFPHAGAANPGSQNRPLAREGIPVAPGGCADVFPDSCRRISNSV